ncbi:hypothetical protein PR202_gb19239 [Eleusine coracana subsp. coracana]|uniref:Uncharacterized protein n=1 Tax=Eleusine coracana subsp. coracana TaxID=191504 RepID=A0AAV5F5G7_ELECO|nr:hypothetical protein PR202_gb19239 [Eleusine coracana subsp. coracana]
MSYHGDRRAESSLVEAFTLSPVPSPVILILLMVTLLLGVSWFFTYEDFIEEATEQLSWLLLAVPIALVLLIRWISSVESFEGYFGVAFVLLNFVFHFGSMLLRATPIGAWVVH